MAPQEMALHKAPEAPDACEATEEEQSLREEGFAAVAAAARQGAMDADASRPLSHSDDTSIVAKVPASSALALAVPDAADSEEAVDEVPDEKPLLDFDDVLPHIGEFGYYQKCLFLLMIPFAWFVAFVYFSQIFITLVPEGHWCRIPELQDLTLEER